MRSVWYHEELRRAVQGAGVSHLHLSTRGLYLFSFRSLAKIINPFHAFRIKESARLRLCSVPAQFNTCTESEFPVFGQTQSRLLKPQLCLVSGAKTARTPSVPVKFCDPRFTSHQLVLHALSVSMETIKGSRSRRTAIQKWLMTNEILKGEASEVREVRGSGGDCGSG